MATTWSESSGEGSATWNSSSGEVAVTWYPLESVKYGFMYWEAFDNLSWEDVTTSALYPENWEDFG